MRDEDDAAAAGAAREMSLGEYVSQLPKAHAARREHRELVDRASNPGSCWPRGEKVADVATGFAGICTGVAFYTTGSTQVLVERASATTGRLERHWFDLERIRAADLPDGCS